MNKVLLGVTTAIFAVAMMGCTHVTSGQPGAKNVTQDAWYVKTTYVLWIPVGTDVYYCPKDKPTQCTRAEME